MARGGIGVCLAASAVLAAPGVFGGTSGKPSADARLRLRAGVFLYAAPGLPDPNFAQTVVLLVHHTSEGAMGLVVNRPTDVPVRDAFTKLGELSTLELPLYWGGPVQTEAITVLLRSARRLDGTDRVLPDVHFTTELGPLKKAARQAEARSLVRVYAGYAGWSGGQLERETRLGSWVVAPADATSVFALDPSALWLRVHDLMRRIEVRLFARPRDVAGQSP